MVISRWASGSLAEQYNVGMKENILYVIMSAMLND